MIPKHMTTKRTDALVTSPAVHSKVTDPHYRLQSTLHDFRNLKVRVHNNTIIHRYSTVFVLVNTSGGQNKLSERVTQWSQIHNELLNGGKYITDAVPVFSNLRVLFWRGAAGNRITDVMMILKHEQGQLRKNCLTDIIPYRVRWGRTVWYYTI